MSAREHDPGHPPDPTKHPPDSPAHHPRYTARWLGAIFGLALAYFGGMGAHEAWQRREHAERDAHELTGGDPRRGRVLARQVGCAQCHTIPGVDGADGLVGPPLGGIASRVYIGGVLTNSPENMVNWILDPRAYAPKTAMPAVGVTEEQARHIAAYLLTLR